MLKRKTECRRKNEVAMKHAKESECGCKTSSVKRVKGNHYGGKRGGNKNDKEKRNVDVKKWR